MTESDDSSGNQSSYLSVSVGRLPGSQEKGRKNPGNLQGKAEIGCGKNRKVRIFAWIGIF